MGKSKFNFGLSPAATEIGEEMSSVNQPMEKVSPGLIGKKRSVRTKTENWTLVQCRLPNDLNTRLMLYLAKYGGSKNDFIEEAIRQLLNTTGA